MKFVQSPYMIALIICFFISCGTVEKGMVKTPILTNKEAAAIPIIQPPKDTIRKFTDAEKNAILDNFYKYGYNKYYRPEFEKLQGSIDRLTETNRVQGLSNGKLVQIIASMRERAIKRTDSTNLVMKAYQDEIKRGIKERIESTKAQTESNKEQIKKSNKVIYYLMIAMAVMFAMIAVLFLFGWFLYRYVKTEFKKINDE